MDFDLPMSRSKQRLHWPNKELARKIRELGDLAEKYCLVSRSVTCPVRYELEVKTTGK